MDSALKLAVERSQQASACNCAAVITGPTGTLVSRSAPAFAGILALISGLAAAQMIDQTTAPNSAREGIAKSLQDEIGAGRGDIMTPQSSLFIIKRDPFRAIRRGRQLFNRKFTRAEGLGPTVEDGAGNINTNIAVGAGLADSCAGCHGHPRGSAGFGGNVVTRPDSRSAPHLFGLGLREMLADEITADLRASRAQAIAQARSIRHPVPRPLTSKGISYGMITAHPDGSVDTSRVDGVNPDLRVRPFSAHGDSFSIREFTVRALQNELGLQAADPDMAAASAGARVTTPAGMVLNGALDSIEAPPADDPNADPDLDGVRNEAPQSLVDYLEFYLLNYFRPATGQQTPINRYGRRVFKQIGCVSCHVADLSLNQDRRVADVSTVYDPVHGNFNRLFATATLLDQAVQDSSSFPPLKTPKLRPVLITDIYTDFKRHDLGPNFYERDYDGSLRTEFLTRPLWGVGSVAPLGHDGRSIDLKEVILRHGGEAQSSRDEFARMGEENQIALLEFLRSLVLFPPDDTASNLNPGDPTTTNFPQFGHGSIKLPVLFNDPTDPE